MTQATLDLLTENLAKMEGSDDLVQVLTEYATRKASYHGRAFRYYQDVKKAIRKVSKKH